MLGKPNYYTVLPADIRYDANLMPFEKLLYCEISALADKKGYCWARNKYLAELLNRHENYISRVISKLTKSGYIQVVIDKNAGNERKIFIGIKKNVSTYTHKGLGPINEKVDTSKHKGLDINKDKQSNLNNPIEQSNTNTFVREDLICLNWEEFYKNYPRHDDKKNAKCAYIKIFKNLITKESICQKASEILNGLSSVKTEWQNKKTEKRFIPLPVTWLNGERWNDEFETGSQIKSKRKEENSKYLIDYDKL